MSRQYAKATFKIGCHINVFGRNNFLKFKFMIILWFRYEILWTYWWRQWHKKM